MISKSVVKKVVVDPRLLFKRISTVSENVGDNVEELFQHEVCAYLSSLFDAFDITREANTPQLTTAIWNMGDSGVSAIFKDFYLVLDGGPFNTSKNCLATWILSTYVTNIARMFKHIMEVLTFDGYISGPSTKDSTHARRTVSRIYGIGKPLKKTAADKSFQQEA